MRTVNYSKVEQSFIGEKSSKVTTNIPYISVDNFPKLGFLTALRFLEWASENPNGVISLPTGKTPEFFIRWTKYLLDNWDTPKAKAIKEKHGLQGIKKPVLKDLKFVQIDEFYPISSKQHNSFFNYVNNYYINGFGLNPDNALLINSDTIPLHEGMHYSEVFPDNHVDLSLRYREATNKMEVIQQKSIFLIDDWCSQYEAKIREMGGIGFFLGGIGPDGHIAFNTRGSDHHSATRLTSTNFETQAVAAGDLGGIEVSKNRLVITIGLETITYNPEGVAIIFAAGEAKAPVVQDALEKEPSNIYPATCLTKLKNSRFYITEGAASSLEASVEAYYKNGEWTQAKTDRAVIDLCKKLNKFGHRLLLEDLKKDKYCSMIPGLNKDTVNSVIESTLSKIEKGTQPEQDQVYYHTGPHHDDVMLGILPHIHRLMRNESNKSYFSVLTSGFTAVTNKFVINTLEKTIQLLDSGEIQMVKYPDFFEVGYKYKWDKDVYHYLIKVASNEPDEKERGLSHRVVRAIVDTYKVRNQEQLRDQINDILSILRKSYDGEKNSPQIQRLKGMIREFEEELVWAYFGIQTKNVHHLRLGFYTGDIFTEQPNRQRDVEPILEKLRETKPTVISLAFDPEGSGPDTHYKVLQAIADAVRVWNEEEDLSELRIWGYRNVWYKFMPSDANVIVPVSLNAMAVMDTSFTNSYLSQVDASFPSYQHNGKFSELTQKTWVDQLKQLQLLLGKKYFYENESPRLRATHGLLYFKEMNVEEFLNSARELEKSMEGMIE
ncbi:glucosamine-6-phosphate isomerase [Flammeovirgaceae bacterium SG7u.111]|nr:glucosamine-6-phosphate isomerase [Flammeovirgaceae bacterium SG7u.132]WPO35719.1 glucosamine-6-phosphate isomerase [Flammeovirgaceae bacterium SG7u.111]